MNNNSDSLSITKISIEKFRHLENIEFKFGKRITIIAGSNGTGKTSLLGLVGHIFTYRSEKTLFNKPFETLFSEVFRFSNMYDIPGEHRYTLVLNNDISKSAVSRSTQESGKPRFRIDVGERKEGEGKINKPVIYLGLKRLIPFAQELESSIVSGKEDKLSNEYKFLFKTYYNKIFATSINVTPKHTKSKNKENYFPTADNYDALGISAGQDNVGQILLSLLSFRHIKDNHQDYNGGLFIIDEIDAALYPAAQKNLLDLLLVESETLNIQIVFTTHSTDIFNYIFSREGSRFKHHTEFVYLNNAKGKVEALQGGKILSEVVADLNHAVVGQIKPKTINVYFEDAEGKIFFNNLIRNTGLNKKVKTQNVSLGCGNYINLLKARFPEFNYSLVVLDGDYKPNLANRYKNKVVFLPGTVRPETVVFDFLNSLPEDDIFWDSVGGYSKRVFIQNSSSLRDDRNVMKDWFNSEKQFWGRGCNKLFKRWKELNPSELSIFLTDLNKKIDGIVAR